MTRTIGVSSPMASVVAANATTRARGVRKAPQSAAAAAIEGPMMLRMSTLSRDFGDPIPRTQACTRNRKARTKTQRPRRTTAVDAVRTSPVRRSLDPAESATVTPARKRKSGAPNPATIISQ